MQHVAIMRGSWGLLPKILSGEKVIESRWYQHKYRPWSAIKPGEWIYFKNSGQPVTARAKVTRVLQFVDLTPDKVRELLNTYGSADGLDERDIPAFYARFKEKRYCMLIFLCDAESVAPFHVSKAGFGAMAAWLTVNSIDNIRVDR